MISAAHQHHIITKLSPYNPTLIGIFGSFARNESTATSDLDILVDFKKTVNLLDLIGIELELTEQIGIKVDLVTKNSVSPLLEKYIQQDMIRIL